MTENETEYIELKVVGRCWTTFPNEILNEIHFQVNPTTQMGKLKRCYSERVGFHVGSLRFLLEGGRFNDDETPETLEMEQNDVIEVFLEQPNWGKSLPAFSKPEFIDLTISFDLAPHRPIMSNELTSRQQAVVENDIKDATTMKESTDPRVESILRAWGLAFSELNDVQLNTLGNLVPGVR